MSEPRTPTGKWMVQRCHHTSGWNYEHATNHDICAIEREMEADTLERMRAANDADPGHYFTPDSLAAALHEVNDDGCRGPYSNCDIQDQFNDEAEAIIKAAKEAEPCCDCRIHVDGICKHHGRLDPVAAKEAER